MTKKEFLLNEIIQTKSLKELIECVKTSIDIIINTKYNEAIENYNNTQFSPAEEYELLLQKEEQINREHISIEHRFKLECETFNKEIDSLESEKSILLCQIVSK